MITTNLDTLRIKSDPIKEDELDTIIQALEDDLEANGKHGVGLSAVQINIPKKVAIIRLKQTVKIGRKKQKRVKKINLYNAEIIKQEQPFVNRNEMCLSLPDQKVDTVRYNNIEVKNGNGEILKFSGNLSVIAQHEIDHWNAILITDREYK